MPLTTMQGSLLDFIRFVRGSQFRFYQERDLGLDLYHTGLPGILLAFLAAAILVVFLLAIFHVIPRRRHVTWLLLGLGAASLLIGFGTAYWHFLRLPAVAAQLIRETAGPLPSSDAQRAALVSLPLVVGALAFVGAALGCLYMALFWGTGMLTKEKGQLSPRA